MRPANNCRKQSQWQDAFACSRPEKKIDAHTLEAVSLSVRATAEPVISPQKNLATRAPWLVLAAALLGWVFDRVALVMEAWPRDKRPLLAGIIGAASNVGFALIAVLGYYFNVTQESWRWVMIAGAAPALLALGIQLVVPESESWKESTKQSAARP